jgi:hypothetical protein
MQMQLCFCLLNMFIVSAVHMKIHADPCTHSQIMAEMLTDTQDKNYWDITFFLYSTAYRVKPSSTLSFAFYFFRKRLFIGRVQI